MRRLTVLFRGFPQSKSARSRGSLPVDAGPKFRFSGSSKKSEMKDEYGDMDSSGETYIAKDFRLESGHVLPEAHVRNFLIARVHQ